MEMKVFENHNSGMYSTSYVMGNYCWNGCQFFHKDQAQQVFDEFQVPQEFRDDITNAFSDEEIPYLEKDKEYSKEYKMFFAKLGRKQDLDILVYDKDYTICNIISSYGYKDLLDILVYNDDWHVRRAIAGHGHKEHLDILVHDDDWHVGYEVAKHGHKEHLDILVYNEISDVRVEVAKHCYKDHLDILVNDNYRVVRYKCLELLNNLK